MIVILLAEGFEEIEALTPLDVLRRAGLETVTVGITGKTVTGAHGISVVADLTADELDTEGVSLAIFPGGMPGAANLDAAEITDRVIESVVRRGGRLAAICAAPLIFGRRGLLRGVRAVCYPGFERELIGATVLDAGVVTDKKITTARGMGVALDFALELVRLTVGKEEAARISEAVMSDKPYTAAKEAVLSDVFLDDDLSDPDGRMEVAERAAEIFSACEGLGITVRLDTAQRGPRATAYRLTAEKTIEKGLSETLCEALGRISGCLSLDINGDGIISLLIENKKPISVGMKGAVSAKEFTSAPSPLTLYLGLTPAGDPIYQDLTRMPHLLIAGSETSVKESVRAAAISILARFGPDKVGLAVYGESDDCALYRGVPHMIMPPVTTSDGVEEFLSKIKSKVEERYALLEETGHRSLREYNSDTERPTEALPYIAVLLYGLPQNAEAESILLSVLQKSRPAGIHVIAADTDKASSRLASETLTLLPSRICYETDRDTVEALIDGNSSLPTGEGNALYRHATAASGRLIHPPRVTDGEFRDFLAFLGGCAAPDSSEAEVRDAEGDIILRAVDVLVTYGLAEASLLTEKLEIPHDVAEATLSALQEIGLVSEEDGEGKRELLLTAEEWVIMKKRITGEAI